MRTVDLVFTTIVPSWHIMTLDRSSIAEADLKNID